MEKGEKVDIASERKSTAKLDELLEIEKSMQKKWLDEKTFEVDAPSVGAQDETYVSFPLERGNMGRAKWADWMKHELNFVTFFLICLSTLHLILSHPV